MTYRMGMSQVKFKVRHNALLLREFTVADVVRATGLNPESVRTELQRMKQEGLLTAGPHPDKPRKRGGPPALYRLTDDPEARLALSGSIEAFYPPAPPTDRPTSRHYLLAQQTLGQVQTQPDDNPQRNQLLLQAERDLEMAEQAEGGSLAPEPVKAYLQYERARLAYLRGGRADAESSFRALREFFASVPDEILVKCIDEFLICLKAWDRFAAGMTCGGVGDTALARCLLNTLAEEAYQADSPLILFSLRLLRQLSQTADEKIRAAAFDMATEASRQIGAEMREAFRAEQMRLTYEATVLRQSEWLPPSDRFQRDELRVAHPDVWKLKERIGRPKWRSKRGGEHA